MRETEMAKKEGEKRGKTQQRRREIFLASYLTNRL